MRRLHAGLPEHVVLVIDAAYAEYVDRPDYTAGAELVEEFANVVMTRTFSKIYALADFGWARRTARPPSPTCSTACADRSTSVPRPRSPASPPWKIRTSSSGRAATTIHGASGWLDA